MSGRCPGRERGGLQGTRALVVVTMAAFAGTPAASVEPAQGSPAIEFTLTRVFASESLVVTGAALSPDGRWIVLTEGDMQQRSNLWVLSTQGGAPVPLTRGPYVDVFPVWFPSGERIAFVSTRPPVFTIMTVPFDPDSGTAAGPPRQVGLDVVGDSIEIDVSPGGKQIAYFSGRALKVIPATGGTARTLAVEGGYMPRWSPDGRRVHYLRGGSGRTRLVRVSVEGGSPETVFTWPGWMSLVPRGANRSFVRRKPQEGSGVEIATLGGRALGRLERLRGMSALGISKDGDQILAIRRDFAAPLTVLPVQGGPARRLAEGRAYEEPLGWSADGKEVLFESARDGESLLFFAPLDGGPMRQVKLPETRRRDFTPVLSADGSHLLYALDGGDDGLFRLEVYSIEEDSSWELSRRHALLRGSQGSVSGAGGGVYRDGPDFIFLERRDDRYELHRSSPRGPARLLRSFAREEPQSVAVHGDRIAYVVNSKTEGSLFLASAGDAPSRRLLTLDGELHQATWSPGGTSIAAYHFDPTAASGNAWKPEGRDLVTLEVSPSGERVGDVRRRSVPGGHWWNVQWLPDGRGIVAAGMDANVWLVPLDAEGRPVNLTQDDPNRAYNYRLSPDGRSIAYASERQTGSSVWLLKLKEPLR